ncbi:hypothetical protein JRO89_XS02G0251100 [Xanthoceras sorbifolium]|uniref:Uncharacterized protein n=1 Tax=Xanthoceras sorbifolium TaxID=99658 RepID=A0ABQ8IGV7_9ROSI|nr:hypothetical protein JRO89_XS02G0251100 [Xanthoceras sorbifolium]
MADCDCDCNNSVSIGCCCFSYKHQFDGYLCCCGGDKTPEPNKKEKHNLSPPEPTKTVKHNPLRRIEDEIYHDYRTNCGDWSAEEICYDEIADNGPPLFPKEPNKTKKPYKNRGQNPFWRYQPNKTQKPDKTPEPNKTEKPYENTEHNPFWRYEDRCTIAIAHERLRI